MNVKKISSGLFLRFSAAAALALMPCTLLRAEQPDAATNQAPGREQALHGAKHAGTPVGMREDLAHPIGMGKDEILLRNRPALVLQQGPRISA